jgi:hypothetical protein
VTEEILIEELTHRTSQLCNGRIVLAIQDTSEVNLTAHEHRLKSDSGLGRLDAAEGTIGFKIHPTLVVDAQSLLPLGFASLDLWHRPLEMPDRRERRYQSLKIEENLTNGYVLQIAAKKYWIKQSRSSSSRTGKAIFMTR